MRQDRHRNHQSSSWCIRVCVSPRNNIKIINSRTTELAKPTCCVAPSFTSFGQSHWQSQSRSPVGYTSLCAFARLVAQAPSFIRSASSGGIMGHFWICLSWTTTLINCRSDPAFVKPANMFEPPFGVSLNPVLCYIAWQSNLILDCNRTHTAEGSTI